MLKSKGKREAKHSRLKNNSLNYQEKERTSYGLWTLCRSLGRFETIFTPHSKQKLAVAIGNTLTDAINH